MHSLRGNWQWKLYNLNEDQGDLNDLSATRPDIMQELTKLWEQYYAETGMINYSFKSAEVLA